MGCASSSEVVTDPRTGQKTTKHKMGGAYPGNRRQGSNPYTPPASAFSNGQATAHFVNYGGGNALVLKQDNGVAQPQMGAMPVKQPEYIQVTLPPGVHAGQKIQVAAPDGRLNEIIIPDGFGPGMTFTVEFADEQSPPPEKYGKVEEEYTYANTGTSNYTPGYTPNLTPYVPTANNNTTTNNYAYSAPVPTAPAVPMAAATATGPSQDDGFASGFNNPNFIPHAGDAKPVVY
ncbi:hypothetical protein IV203_034856 [Nitzschia inconspicua]|uniref:Uncharacterized protein n=1 Tax=Nitzschia inconspicua TaxID=303405 RepID=A0A9K3PU98_9STRA|nr:hypothetical protein IV203_034856 [Nitzschia inconspicua]